VFSNFSSGTSSGYKKVPGDANQHLASTCAGCDYRSVTFTIEEWPVVELVGFMAELVLVILDCGGEIPATHPMLARE